MFTLENYTIIAAWLPRLLGAIYFFAFGAFLFQMKGLFGERGILPVKNFLYIMRTRLPKRCYSIIPSLFWINASDRALMGLVAVGTTLSLLLLFGVYPCLLLFIVYLLYLSLISVGQDFLSFGWEMFLQEVSLNALLISLTGVPNLMVWLSINFLLFRFHIQSGAVKLQSRDPNWKNLTAIFYHYQSQPIPNVVAWYIHKLPMWFHKLSCLMMFVVELAVPVFLFFSEDIRLVVCALFLGLQFFIWATGNFSYLNHLTAVLCLILLNNTALLWLGFEAPEVTQTPLLLDGLLSVAGATLLVLQIIRLWDHFFPFPLAHRILSGLSPFHIVNRYGIFAIMTTTRYEMVVEGSEDGQIWKEYLFYHKPTRLNRRPRRISPYQPRIDWQAWFLPFRYYLHECWFQNFLARLLLGTKEVLGLLAHNPFPERPPKYVRTLIYIYSFTSSAEKKATGNWWKRQFVGHYSPTLSLR